jgi:hypothetical protein
MGLVGSWRRRGGMTEKAVIGKRVDVWHVVERWKLEKSDCARWPVEAAFCVFFPLDQTCSLGGKWELIGRLQEAR